MNKRHWAAVLLATGAALTATAVASLFGRREWKHHRLRQRAPRGRNRVYADAARPRPYDEALAAHCVNGIFLGQHHEGVLAFKGIPYAQQPVRALRWKAPLPPHADRRVWTAHHFGPSPLQSEREQEAASFTPQAEACLHLNVWCTADRRKKRPVMVFFYGGSYAWGGSSNPLYDGHRLVAAHPDVVLVTVDYRVGALGFIDFSQVSDGEDYPDAPNLGLLDQIQALRWVRDNIAAFGGDAEQVTIFGESAGGGSVSILAAMPEARGLFRRVIAQSGSIALSYAPEQCQAFTRKLLRRTGCTTMQELIALPTAELRKVLPWIALFTPFPQRNGRHIPTDLYEAYANGATTDYDLLIGTNTDEVRYWMQEVGGYTAFRILLPLLFRRNQQRLSAEDRERIERYLTLPETDPVWKKSEFFTELFFRLPALRQAELHIRGGGRAFVYSWAFPSSLPHLGACHAVELAYVFGNLDQTVFTGKGADHRLAAKVQQMWVNFACTGNPSLPEIEWPPYDVQQRPTLCFDTPLRIDFDPKREARELLTPLLRHRLGNIDWAF